jgi:hypothetical protein
LTVASRLRGGNETQQNPIPVSELRRRFASLELGAAAKDDFRSLRHQLSVSAEDNGTADHGSLKQTRASAGGAPESSVLPGREWVAVAELSPNLTAQVPRRGLLAQ